MGLGVAVESGVLVGLRVGVYVGATVGVPAGEGVLICTVAVAAGWMVGSTRSVGGGCIALGVGFWQANSTPKPIAEIDNFVRILIGMWLERFDRTHPLDAQDEIAMMTSAVARA